MKGKSFMSIFIAALLITLISIFAYALDYPHFGINNIGCDSCHFVYGTQPSLLPPWTVHTPQDIDDTQFNTLCWSCHNDIDAPYMRTHSSLQTDTDHGNWTVECRVCHNPHYQKQSRTYGTPSYLYSGASTGVTTTTITKSGAIWGTNAYAGYVVYPNVSQKNYNYKILSNTADTLTVQGPINLAKAAVGNVFAIVYGNLINDVVDLSKIIITPAKSGSKTTRFFNTTGTNSFADGDTTYDGVCEVCHTQTTHFKNDGTGTDQLHANMGSPAGTRCTNCHSHVNGFRGMGGGAHTTHVQKGYGPQLACAECHGANVPPMLADGQNLANTTVCDTCHSVSGAAIAKQYWGNAGSSEGAAGSWAVLGGEINYCGSCHDATPGNTKGDGSGDTAFNVMGDNSTYGYSVNGHGKTAGNYARLSWQATSATGNPAANRQCSACHNLTSQHFNNPGKRLKAGYENDAGNGNCKQCHDQGKPAVGAPQWYTTYADYQNSAHSTTKCSACHDVHGASVNYPAMTKADQETLCYQCHTEGEVQNVAISGPLVADDIQQAFNLTYKHDLGTSFTISGSSYTLECVSCHNVHVVTGKYWDAASGKSPVTRFTNNTAVWGASAGQKINDYAAAGSTPGIYVTLPSDTFSGSQLPDYPSFCLDCHGTGGSNLDNLEPSPYFKLNWDDDSHGRQAAGAPAGGSTYPDWDGVGYNGGESNDPAWKIPKTRGFEVRTYQPYDMGKRIIGDNFVMSCTDCHEAHGSNNSKMQRSVSTQEAGPAIPTASCQSCHYTYSPWHEGQGCGGSSCHQTADIHRIRYRGGPGTYIFDNTRPAYIKFDGEQYDVTDSGSWKNHGRWLKNNAPVDSGTFAAGVYNQAGVFDGSSDAVELGTRKYNVTSHGTADSNSNYRNTYLYFEMKNNVTLEAWIKPAQLGGKRVIMSNEIADANYSFSIRDDIPGVTGPRLVFQLYLQDSPDQRRGAYSNVEIAPNTWTHVTAAYDAFATDGKRIKIYKSGQDVTANTGTGEFAQPSNDAEIFEGSTDGLKQRFVIGANPDGVSDFFNGLIDEAYVYNITRTPAQVLVDAASPVGAVAMTAVASDVSLGGRGVQSGDKVVITFSAATNGPLITNGNVNAAVALSNGHSWLDGSGNIGSAQWSTMTNANDTLTITLSDTNGPPSVADGDTMTVNSGVVTDIYGAPLNTSCAITGTFGIGNSQGMVGWWMLDEGSGTTASDSSGEDNDGTIFGAAWTSGKVNSSLNFDGVDDYVSVLNDASLNVSDISLEAWVNSSGYTGSNLLGTANYMVFSRQSAGSTVNGYELGINSDGKPYFTFEDASTDLWTKYDNSIPANSDTSSTNGRVPMGTSGKGDSFRLGKASIVKDGSTYKMWYQGLPDSGGSDTRIYYATSTDGLSWTKYDNTIPTDSDGSGTNGRIPLGTSGKGDEYSIGAATVLKEDTTYKMWYTGSNDGNSYRIYYATSSDGLTWTKYDNSIPSNSDTTGTNGRIPPGTSGKGDSAQVANPTVIKDGSTYKMWYTGKSASSGFTNRIYYATSPDGLTWTKYDNNIPADSDSASTNGRIPLGTSGKGDDGFAYNPTVIKDGSTYKMWYTGFKDPNVQNLFFATSPDGLTWTKYDNSVPTPSNTTGTNGRIPRGTSGGDSNYVISPTVIKDGSTYKMWYVGDDGTVNAPRRIFYATQDVGLTGNALTSGWHHVVGTKANDGTLKLYVDGNETASGATSVTGISNNSDLLIGSLFSGRLDELVLYNRALTPIQVTDRYNSGFDYSTPPAAPTIGIPGVLSANSIRWYFTDNATNEEGFKLHDSSETVMASSATQDLTYLDETGLTANTQYTRHVHAYNPAGDSSASGNASKYTLPVTPNVTADKSTSTWYNTTDVVFTNAAGFGSGGVQYYRYAWDQTSTYTFTDTELQWSSGTLTKTATATGGWYLHVKSYNAEDIGNGSTDYGPFNYDATNPSSSNLSPADGAINIALNSNLTFTLSDAGSGIDWSTFSIQLTGSNGYSQSYNSASPEVTKTGDAASYNVTVDPAVSFSNNEVITVDVNASDSTGNPLSPPLWSFTTLDLPSGAVSYWKLDEGSGQSASDSVGTNNGTLGTTSGSDAGDPAWSTSGKISNALSFDGTDDYVNLGNPASLNVTSAVTLAGWIRTSSTKGQMLIIAKHNGSSNGSYYLGTSGSANVLRLMIVNSSSVRVNLDRAFTYNDNQWHYIVGTYDGSNMRLYADGNLLGSPAAQTGSIKTTSYNVRIGSYTQDNLWVFSGLIDEVEVYNRALTASEVLDRYNAGGP